jgi:hypothetical protein
MELNYQMIRFPLPPRNCLDFGFAKLTTELRRGRLHRSYSNGEHVTVTASSAPSASYPAPLPGTRLDRTSRLRLWDSTGQMRLKRVQPTLLGHCQEFT